MSGALKNTFARCKKEKRNALLTFITAGFPSIEETVPLMLALQDGGSDIIELGMPFTDPIADGPTIQMASQVALENGVRTADCLQLVRDARAAGVTVPIVLMGYYNPIMAYGEEKFVHDSRSAGVDGYIIVDLSPEKAVKFRQLCTSYELSYVPLVAPSTTGERLAQLASGADSFVYIVSRMGVTGSTGHLDSDLPSLLKRVTQVVGGSVPLAVGFGISTREHVMTVGAVADGVVIGSHIISLIHKTPKDQRCQTIKQYISDVTGRSNVEIHRREELAPRDLRGSSSSASASAEEQLPTGWFGDFGGQFVPEILHRCLAQLEAGFNSAVNDPEFWKEYRRHYSYMNRPSQLHEAETLTKQLGGAHIWLKREDLNHTGSHKINNALGQALLAKRLGKTRLIAETGAGQHGVATATVAAKFGLKCIVYMGAEDVRRQALNVFRIRLLGAEVVPVHSGSKTLRDATTEAMRTWVTMLDDTHYVLGSATGPHPYPTLVRTMQSVIGEETKKQFAELNNGKLPDALVACVGGGSNCSGMFSAFVPDEKVQLLGVEAAGHGINSKKHAATLTSGKEGVLHGVRTYLLQDENGHIFPTYSVSAGLDYPGVGPELAHWKKTGRVKYVAATDEEALSGFRLLSQTEGIIPALETSHAVYAAAELAKSLPSNKHIVICLSGRGDKDVQQVADILPELGPKIGWDLRFEADPSKIHGV